MKTQIEKLMKEYDEKVEMEDKRLKIVEGYIREARAAGANYDELRTDRKIINARRQAYVQAKSDIDSLLDYV
jgi:hypothetical protein